MPAHHSQPLWKRKRKRLDASAYAQPGAVCSLTAAVKDHLPVFANAAVAATAVDVLRAHAAKTGTPVYAYCVMPDHIHLVVGPSSSCDITTFVGQYKNLAQRAAWSCGVEGSFWQKSFWDHFLRIEEGLQEIVDYVLYNPVRRGLVEEWRDYPFCGSLVFEL